MVGYDPRCPNCHKCWHCSGNGSLMVRKWDGGKSFEVRETCPRCNGRGGSVGVGEHLHR